MPIDNYVTEDNLWMVFITQTIPNAIQQFSDGRQINFENDGNNIDNGICYYATDIPDLRIAFKKNGQTQVRIILTYVNNGIRIRLRNQLTTPFNLNNHEIDQLTNYFENENDTDRIFLNNPDEIIANNQVFNILLNAQNFIPINPIVPALDNQVNDPIIDQFEDNMPLNKILYGPPGTGKTYVTAELAVKICDGNASESRVENMNRYRELEKEGRISFVTFHQSYGYEEFVEGLRPVLVGQATHAEESGQGDVKYHIAKGVFYTLCQKAKESQDNNYVLIVDEINRGNISKIFGELITLIEKDKRKDNDNSFSVKLSYSQEDFCVPKNVYIIGTMNTADRSLAQMDIALRRRFHFKEMMPDYTVLDGVQVNGINIPALLKKINDRIEALYDREHTIGHAYFTSLLDMNEDNEKFTELSNIFQNKIIPLLEEYFFDDWDKIRKVLGNKFIQKNPIDQNLFENDEEIPDMQLHFLYSLNKSALNNVTAYTAIYQ